MGVDLHGDDARLLRLGDWQENLLGGIDQPVHEGDGIRDEIESASSRSSRNASGAWRSTSRT